MHAPARTTRRLNAALAAFFLIALSTALAPQAAQARGTRAIILTVTPGDEQVTLNWDVIEPSPGILADFTTWPYNAWAYNQREESAPHQLTYNWIHNGTPGTTRTFTVTGLANGTRYCFRVAVGNSIDGIFRGAEPSSIEVCATPRPDTGVTISKDELLIVEGSTGNYTVVLDTQPAGNVTVAPTSSDPGAATVSSALTFTNANWNSAQTITVTGVKDDDAVNESVTITHAVTGSVNTAASVTVTVLDTHVVVTPTELAGNGVGAPSDEKAVTLDSPDDGDSGAGDGEVVEKVVETVEGDGVFFSDAGLAGVVARALGATDLARRNEPEVALLRELNAARSGVADLAGLEIASGLKSLDLSGNRITDLTPLAALDGLTKLILSGNPDLEDLAPLAGLTLLGNLDLSSNRRIVDLAPLSGLALLETLRLDRTGASDLTPLAGLVRLRTLNLSWNRQIVDLSALSGLTMLRTLRLDRTGASDFSLLSTLTELRTLSLSGNGITDLSPLQTLAKLSFLHLGANRIEDVSLLAGLTALRSLSLNDNLITDVTVLAALPRLASLNLSGNALLGFPSTGFRQLRGLYLRDCGLADIGALANLAEIETLFLDGNGISDLSPLSSLYGLTKLFLARNEVADLTPLSWLPALRQLVLDDNNIADVAPLSSLSGLTKLFLARNEVSDLTPLSQLAELEQLVLDGNDIADVSALSGLRKLELLSLGQNQVSDIAALAELPDLEYLDLRENPLDPDALNVHIPALEERGVQVLY